MPARTAAGFRVFAFAAGACVALTLSGVRIAARPRPNQAQIASASLNSPADPSSPRALVNQYCVSCHSSRLSTAGLDLESAGSHDARIERRRVGEGDREAARRLDAAARTSASGQRDVSRGRRPDSSARSIARGRRSRIPAASPRSIVSIASNTTTPSAICSRSTSTSRRCCRVMKPRTAASTTSPIRSRFRRRIWSAICRSRAR